MIRKILLSCLILCLTVPTVTVPVANVRAQPDDGTRGSCGWQNFKEALGARESGGDYKVVNASGYMGKYQFGKAALTDLGYMTEAGNWTGKDGIGSREDFLNSPQAQERAMEEWGALMNRNVEAAGLEKYIGQTIGGCTITRSGMLAGRHLVGIGNADRPGLKAYLESNGETVPKDGNGTPISEYVCKFGGYATPFDGTAAAAACGTGGTGGGMEYPGTPGEGKNSDFDPDGDGAYTSTDYWERLREAMMNLWVTSMMMMANQLSATMISQIQMIGMMLDAKHQMETQRIFQELTARAHKDYQPSEQMCTFGTFTLDLAVSERFMDQVKQVVVKKIMQRELGEASSAGGSTVSDKATRLNHFIKRFCNPRDNAEGLTYLCPTAAPANMRNADINYSTTIDQNLSLDVNFMDETLTDDEEKVFALIDNLFAHESMPRMPLTSVAKQKVQYQYFNMRSIMAMRGIARNSVATIVALKSSTPNDVENAAPYMRALLTDFGLTPAQIQDYLGENPSYDARMALLTKTIFQAPSFMQSLNTSPANLERIRVAIAAIKLMQDRDIQEAFQRREILLSMVLELRLRQHADNVYNATENALFDKN